MPKPKTIKHVCATALKTAGIITTLFVVVYLINLTGCYRPEHNFIPQNELGEIDYYGVLPYGEIPPAVLERIKDRKVEIVSKGFVMRYYEMKERLEDLGEYIWD